MPALIRICVLPLLVLPPDGRACSCLEPSGVCNVAGASDLVFISNGRVNTLLLDAWNVAQLPSARRLTQETQQPDANSRGSLESLRKTYLDLFPDLPGDMRKLIAGAPSADSLTRLWYAILGRGRLVRLRVTTTFRMGDDDDDDQKDSNDSASPEPRRRLRTEGTKTSIQPSPPSTCGHRWTTAACLSRSARLTWCTLPMTKKPE